MSFPVADSYKAPSGGVIAGGRFLIPASPETAYLTTFPPTIQCSIPVVEGYSAYVHPKVLDTGTPGWNGYRYWMCNTNYPGTNDEVENPSVFVSDDGTTWISPGANPVVPKPVDWAAGVKYNSDNHIMLHDGVMYLYWRVYHTAAAPRETLKCVYSSDGVMWSEPQTILTVHEDWDSGLLSPVIDYVNGEFFLFSMRNRVSPTSLVLRKATSPLGPWSSMQTSDLALPAIAGSRQMWHMDAVPTKRGWAMLLCDRGVSPTELWFAHGDTSGLIWQIKSTPLTTTNPWQYRPSLVKNGRGFDCWLTNYTADPHRCERSRIEYAQ